MWLNTNRIFTFLLNSKMSSPRIALCAYLSSLSADEKWDKLVNLHTLHRLLLHKSCTNCFDAYFHYFCATRESRLSWSSLSVYYESPSAPHVYSRSNNTTQTRFHKSCTICKYPRIRGRTGIWEQSQSRVYVVHWRSWAWRKLHDFVNTRKYVQIVQLLCNTVCSIRKRRPWWKKKKRGPWWKKFQTPAHA